MDKISIGQIQCPNCGKTQMSKIERFGFVPMFLSIITLGLYALVCAIWTARRGDQKIKSGDRIKCLNCKSRWVYEGNQAVSETLQN